MPPALSASHPLIVLFTFAFGATVGSFLNVCIYRMPLKQSVSSPTWSYCFSCGERLRFWDLIPLVSALVLRFRCRHCGRRFSPQYFFVELLSALWFVGCVLRLGLTVDAVLALVAGSVLIVVIFIDLRHLIIPDELIWILAVLGIVWDLDRLATYQQGWGLIHFGEQLGGAVHTVYLPRSIVGMALGAGAFLALALLFDKVFRKESMGFGDVKLAGAMGAIFGPGYVFLSWFLLAVFVGAVVGLTMMLIWRLRREEKVRFRAVPFGPMLGVSGMIHLLWGAQVAAWLLARYWPQGS